MTKLSSQETARLMDTIAYGYVAGCGKNKEHISDEEIKYQTYMLTELYCQHESLIPNYTNVYDKTMIDNTEINDDDDDEETDIDDYDEKNESFEEESDDYDDDNEEELNDEDEYDDNDDIMGFFKMFEH